VVGEDKVKHQGWIASLSNGETIFQSPNVPGERTAWGKIQDRCEEEEIYITQIQLQLYGNTLVGMANADGYTAFYEQAQSWSVRDKVATYQGIGSVIGDWVVVMFLNDSGHIWQDLRLLSHMRDHCQLKPKDAIRPARPRPLDPSKLPAAGVQAIDIADKEESQLLDEDFEQVAEFFRANAHLKKQDDVGVAYEVYRMLAITVSPEEVADFRLAFWD
jgi:hypothetical protein